MEKEFIPYEQALFLKELGFDEHCIKVYHTDKDNGFNINEEFNISAPLYQQAFRWFREKYNLIGGVYNHYEKYGFQIGKNEIKRGYYSICNSRSKEGLFISYEEAELECLKKLIEIVKNKL